VLSEILIVVSAVVLLSGVLLFMLPHLYAKLSRIRLAHRCRKAGAVVLTYDDGPGASITPKLIQLLRIHASKATFFCLGMRAVAHPQVMDRLKKEGHEIACHSFRHCHPWKVRPSAAWRDIVEGFESLSRWLSKGSWFRPPHGKLTLYTWLPLLARRSRIVWWTHDSGDTHAGETPSVEAIVRDVVRSGGGVVLLHDFDRTDEGGPGSRGEFVMSVTRELIEQSGLAGLKIMTLGELFNLKKS
jgi:peptidoglycan-N-acetylglucosamine deacetylase